MKSLLSSTSALAGSQAAHPRVILSDLTACVEDNAKTIEETKKGIDVLSELNGDLLTLWMGQDGFDYSFQADYRQIWDWTIDALREITSYNPKIKIFPHFFTIYKVNLQFFHFQQNLLLQQFFH